MYAGRVSTPRNDTEQDNAVLAAHGLHQKIFESLKELQHIDHWMFLVHMLCEHSYSKQCVIVCIRYQVLCVQCDLGLRKRQFLVRPNPHASAQIL